MLVARLWVKLGLEYSTLLSVDEILDDTDDSGIEVDNGFDGCVWFLKPWDNTDPDCLDGWGVGLPWASSASRLRRFIIVGRNLDEIDSNPASCRQKKKRTDSVTVWFNHGSAYHNAGFYEANKEQCN